jgi:lipopolysaccharide export system protein LptA
MNKLIIATILIFASIVSAKGAEFTKSSLEKLSDQELILKAIDSGNYSNIIFGGTEALNPDIPSYKKDLENREELIELLAGINMAIEEPKEKKVKQPIEIEANSVMVNEATGFNEFIGDAEVRQGTLEITANLIQVQTNADGVETLVAEGTKEKPAKYIQSQETQSRFIEATATLITYDVNEGMIFLVGDAYLVQGFDSFSGDSLTYDINDDKVLVKGSEDGTKRVKFKIDL